MSKSINFTERKYKSLSDETKFPIIIGTSTYEFNNTVSDTLTMFKS